MRLVVLQPPYPLEGTEAAASSCQDWMIKALREVDGEVDLVVLPEYATVPGLGERRQIRKFGADEGEGFLDAIRDWSRDRGSWAAVGTVADEEGRLLNRVVLIDRAGKISFEYDKIHLTEAESDGLEMSAGSRVDTTLVDEVRVGVATCFDFYFAEYFAALSNLSPDLILSPAYQRSESPERLVCMSQTRAIDSGAWFVRSSYAIAGGRTGGCSLVVAPDGEVVVNAGGESGVIEAEIDPKVKFVKPRSHGMPDVNHRELIASRRRPDVY